MSIIGLLIAVFVLAVVFWLLQSYVVPHLPRPLGMILLIILALIAIFWLLSGLFGGFGWHTVHL